MFIYKLVIDSQIDIISAFSQRFFRLRKDDIIAIRDILIHYSKITTIKVFR